jgi:CBS-domain-containing membrane protein
MPMTVQNVMTSRVVAVPALAGFRQVVGLLRTHHVSALPVLDKGERVVGVISVADLYLKQVRARHGVAALLADRRWRLDRHKATGASVAELMSAPAVTIRADQSLPRPPPACTTTASNASRSSTGRACWSAS